MSECMCSMHITSLSFECNSTSGCRIISFSLKRAGGGGEEEAGGSWARGGGGGGGGGLGDM